MNKVSERYMFTDQGSYTKFNKIDKNEVIVENFNGKTLQTGGIIVFIAGLVYFIYSYFFGATLDSSLNLKTIAQEYSNIKNRGERNRYLDSLFNDAMDTDTRDLLTYGLYRKSKQNPPEYIELERPKNVLYKLLQKAEQKTSHVVEFENRPQENEDDDF